MSNRGWLKEKVIALHRMHPAWTSTMIAEALDCDDAYVRSTFYRNNLVLPGKDGIVALGKAALKAGLTVAAIEKLSKRAA